MSRPNIYVALVHYPVVNRRGDTVASAVTNLDLHDISRVSRTYGVDGFYVVTPLDDQKELVKKITGHWTEGVGGEFNPDRKDALHLIKLKDSLQDSVEDIKGRSGRNPDVIFTSAKENSENIGFRDLRAQLSDSKSYLLVFGTASGISEELFEMSGQVLEPIYGGTDYNHLSVRSAVSIVLDRLLGEY